MPNVDMSHMKLMTVEARIFWIVSSELVLQYEPSVNVNRGPDSVRLKV